MHLPLVAKVEVFEYALDSTEGNDLARVLWLKSRTSEVWLDRRTNYTRSLAVMSMVGYLLGLGDRHPSNLMLHRFSYDQNLLPILLEFIQDYIWLELK
ncbi:serine/threonine-protein kinase TOR-like [Bidens hawaiensis]|uniref:serine/threonine-protein kinase TOR-like n=1 Tax=Bidens hawaiensis TaxID=980011 RepID=UPI00404A77CF